MRSGNKKACTRGAAALCAAAAIALSACASSLSLQVAGNSLSLEGASFSSELSDAAQRLSATFLGQEAIFDKKTIEEAFAAIDFPSPAAVTVEGEGGERLRLEFSTINLESGIFLKLTDGDAKAFDLDAGKKRLLVTLTRETVAKTIASLPDELFEFADLLMAPVLTGERMTEEEYLILIAAAYGPQAARELEACSLLLTVRCPDDVIEASAREFAGGALGGNPVHADDVAVKAKGAEASFAIPAVKFFTLSSPLQLEVRWGR